MVGMFDYFSVVMSLRQGTVLYRMDRFDLFDPDEQGLAFSEITTLDEILNQMAGYSSDSGVKACTTTTNLDFDT
ncbi:MAG: hypothetical protein ACOC0D_06560 [Spirochaeta sp.]